MVTLFFIRVVSVAIVLSIVIPVLMAMAVNYPISDFIHGPYNHCIGRFEVYFNPKHPDPFTPGRREGGRHCDDTYIWATVPDLSQGTRIFRLSIFSICKFTKLLFWLVTFCVPEMILYPVTFRYITTSTNQIARSGILLPDMVTRRRQQNSINIYVTWLACIAQFVTNIIFVVLMKGFFGKIAGQDTAKVEAKMQLSVSGFVTLLPVKYVKCYGERCNLGGVGKETPLFTTEAPLLSGENAVLAVNDIQSTGSKVGEAAANVLAVGMTLSGYGSSTTSVSLWRETSCRATTT